MARGGLAVFELEGDLVKDEDGLFALGRGAGLMAEGRVGGPHVLAHREPHRHREGSERDPADEGGKPHGAQSASKYAWGARDA